MAIVGSAKIVWEADDTDYLRSVMGMEKKTKKTSNFMTGIWQGAGQAMFRSMQTLFFAPFKLAMTGITSATRLAFNQFKAGVSSAANLEEALAEVATLGVENIEELRDGVLDLSSALGEDAVRMTRALYQAISAGVPEDNVLEFLRVAGEGAIAGLTDTATMVDALTSILASFNMEWDQAREVADKFFTTIRFGKTTAAELAPVIGRIAPLASVAGVSLDELFALIAKGTQTGMATSEVITGLTGAMRFLVKPSKQALAVFESWGATLEDVKASVAGDLGLIGVLESANQSGVLNQLNRDVMGLNVAFAVLGQDGGDTTRELTSEMKTSAGASATAFETMEGVFKRVSATIVETFKNLREETLAPFVEAFTPMAEALKELWGPAIKVLREKTKEARGIVRKFFDEPLKREDEFGPMEISRGEIFKQEALRLGQAMVDNFKLGVDSKPYFEIIKDWWRTSDPEVQKLWDNTGKIMIETIGKAWIKHKQTLITTFRDIIEAMKPALNAAWEGFGRQAASGFARGFLEIYMRAIANPFERVFGEIGGELANITRMFGDLGNGSAQEPSSTANQGAPSSGAQISPGPQMSSSIIINIDGGNPERIVQAIRDAQRMGQLSMAGGV